MRAPPALFVVQISPDPRVRVFRRTLRGLDGFECMEVDAYLVLGERYALLLDTLLCPADVAWILDLCAPDLANRELLCINSHADWDHAWGNGYFQQQPTVPILAHEACRQRLLSEEARQQLRDYQARFPLFREVTLRPPSLTFSQRLTIVDGELSVELLHAPGHCPDQIVAWLPSLGLLLAFDAVEHPLPAIADAAGAPLMLATLRRLAALNARQVLCSHGNTTSPALIEHNLAYLREIAHRCRILLADHAPTAHELEHTVEHIGYPFEEVVAGLDAEIDRSYYSQTHAQNAQAILRWLAASAQDSAPVHTDIQSASRTQGQMVERVDGGLFLP
ncbi:MAG TPA: MBL fold metallo-hydrolase [Ktedonobacteraceae bacterium]|jgi:glyoxylase-like metal-dependent hydrolase (beta-lactamase superfamily II)